MVDVRWVWVFLDTVETDAGPSWEFWRQVTRSTLSPTRGERGEFATFLPAHGDPWLKVQAVQSGGGVHLDLDVDDPRAAADEAASLGARELGTIEDETGAEGVVIMASPAGQVFCFTTASAHPGRQERSEEPDLVDQVCLDVPEDGFAVDAVFWHELTGWDLGLGRHHEFTTLTRPDGIPVRLALQRLGDPTGIASAHVDLACRDRAATAAAHARLGAEVVGEGARWTVMRDPVGRAYCLTDRDPGTGRLPEPAAATTHDLGSAS